MSLVKQILIAIAATITLVLFGWGSYVASQQIFPDPTSSSNSANKTPTPTVTSSVPTVSDYKTLVPKNIKIKKVGDNYQVSFETAYKTGATLYVTTSKTEKINNAMKDYQNGVPNVGKWFVATKDGEPNMTHSVTIPSTALAKTGDTYYYVLLSYKASWLPYGGVMDYTTGPTEPYILKTTE